MAGFGWRRPVRMVLMGLVWCCLAASLAFPVMAADGPRLLRQGEEHYQFAEWAQARQILNQALAAGGLSPAQKARAYFHLGLVDEAQGDMAEATDHFALAKAADPGWSPDPSQFPPSALALFGQTTASKQDKQKVATGPLSLPTPPPPPAPGPALQPPGTSMTKDETISERELPPAVEPAPEPSFSQQDLIEKRRQARLTFVEGVDFFNAGHYAEAEQRFLTFLAVFPGDPEGGRFLALTQKTLASQSTGNLRVACRQPATVYLDGRPVGSAPLALDKLPLGRHMVEVRDGQLSQTQAIEIKGRTTTSIEFDLTRHEVPAEADPVAVGGYRHPALGFSLTPPPGWRVAEKPADADLKLIPASGEGFIQVNSTGSQRQLNVATYADLWDRSYLENVQPGAQRLASQARNLAAGPAWQAEYLGDGVRTVVVFVSRPQRIYVLTGAWTGESHGAMLASFDAVVESFRAP